MFFLLYVHYTHFQLRWWGLPGPGCFPGVLVHAPSPRAYTLAVTSAIARYEAGIFGGCFSLARHWVSPLCFLPVFLFVGFWALGFIPWGSGCLSDFFSSRVARAPNCSDAIMSRHVLPPWSLVAVFILAVCEVSPLFYFGFFVFMLLSLWSS